MDEELKAFEPQLEFFIAQHKKHPIGIIVDLTEMQGAEWKARWDDLRFLQKHTNHIARMAVVGAHRWEEVVGLFTAGAPVLQSETLRVSGRIPSRVRGRVIEHRTKH